jgi:NitT/TauT family transport system permease protein
MKIPFNTFPFEKQSNQKKYTKIIYLLIVPVIILITWHFTSNAINKPYIFPTPKNTFALFLHPNQSLLSQGSLLQNTFISLLRIFFGFFIAVTLAIPIGAALGSFATLRQLFEPIIEFLRPISPIAWLPFAIAIFKITTVPESIGLGYTKTIFDHLQIGMIAIIALGAFFPILINTIDGVAGVRRDYIRLASMLGANKKQLLLKVAIPAASPMIFTGIRQGIGLSWKVIIAAEMLPGSNAGIGYLLIFASDQSAMNIVLATIIIIGTIGCGLNFLMKFLTKKMIIWQRVEV